MVWLLSGHVISKHRSFNRALIQWCKALEQLRTSNALTLAWKLKVIDTSRRITLSMVFECKSCFSV